MIAEHVFQRCRVLLLCLEDGKDELRRRLRAAMLHHGIAHADIKGRLFLSAVSRSDLKLARTAKGELEVGHLAEVIDAEIKQRQIDAVILDPFVKSHSVAENDNTAIDFVVETLAEIAIRRDIAVGLLHHTRKGATDPGDADAGRGASALKNGTRLAHTLTKMTDEAKHYNLSDEDATQFIRLDSGKVNPVRHSKRARWFKLVGVNLNNGTTLYPHGDEVQTIEPWTPPDLWQHISTAVAYQILDKIDAGPGQGQRYSVAPQSGKDRGAWSVVLRICGTKLSKEQCNKVIKTWVDNGIIEERVYDDPVERKPLKGAYVIKRPGPV